MSSLAMPEGFDIRQAPPWTPRPVEPEIVVDVADEIVETDVLRKWRRFGFVDFECPDGGQLDVQDHALLRGVDPGGIDPRDFLSIGTSDIGNASSVFLPVEQVMDLHRVLGEWLSHRLPAASGPAGPASLDAACEEAVASSEHQTP